MNRARSKSRLRAALFLGVGLATTGIALVAYGTNVFRELELDTVDARFSVRGEQAAPAEIEVVAIDDITFSDFNSNAENIRWPFPRRYFARVIDRLAEDGAKRLQRDVDDLVFVDQFEVRGRQGTVKTWSLQSASVQAFEARAT